MASTTDRVMSLRAVRQLRRVRAFYTGGVLLWAVLTAWTAWQSPGSRQMWVSTLLLTAFSGRPTPQGLATAVFLLRQPGAGRTNLVARSRD